MLKEDSKCQSTSKFRGENPETESICRICLDHDLEKLMISPCNCSGSVKYVHEYCLKNWLNIKTPSLNEAKCEICGVGYNISCTYKRKCVMSVSFGEGFIQCFLVPFTLMFIFILLFIIYVILENFFLDPGDKENFLYGLPILVISCISCAIFVASILRTLKDICIRRELLDWAIYGLKTNL